MWCRMMTMPCVLIWPNHISWTDLTPYTPCTSYILYYSRVFGITNLLSIFPITPAWWRGFRLLFDVSNHHYYRSLEFLLGWKVVATKRWWLVKAIAHTIWHRIIHHWDRQCSPINFLHIKTVLSHNNDRNHGIISAIVQKEIDFFMKKICLLWHTFCNRRVGGLYEDQIWHSYTHTLQEPFGPYRMRCIEYLGNVLSARGGLQRMLLY